MIVFAEVSVVASSLAVKLLVHSILAPAGGRIVGYMHEGLSLKKWPWRPYLSALWSRSHANALLDSLLRCYLFWWLPYRIGPR